MALTAIYGFQGNFDELSEKKLKIIFLSLLLCICDLLVCSHASFSAKVLDLQVTLV